MFRNKYLYLAALSINLACVVCFVNYNQFEGFEATPETLQTFDENITPNLTLDNAIVSDESNPTVSTTITSKRKGIHFTNHFYLTTPKVEQKKTKIDVKSFNMKCPENEMPSSIGTYEIPTQRDLVLFTQRTLLRMFNSYHSKTMILLKDINEATRATTAVGKKCHGGEKRFYRQCVKEVNKKFVTVTKQLVQMLEQQEAQVIALTEGKICNLASMKTNPIQLIKILAMDEATLDFALPAFLRLLGGCAAHCNKPPLPDHRPRLRQLTDQELVVRHFLTSKNYLQLLKDKYV